MNNKNYSNQKIIIFEGHDKSGKSTIANELSLQLNIPVFKVKRDNHKWDPDINLKYLTEGITQFIEQTSSSVILDRWHGSDFMYNRLFNRNTNDEKVFDIDNRMSRINAKIIICYKQPSAYEVDEEDADFVNPSMYTRMTEYYRDFADKTECSVIFLDTTNQNLQEQIEYIKANI